MEQRPRPTRARIARLGVLPVALALAAGGLAGCTVGGSSAPPVVLRIVTDDDATKPAGQQITHFAAEVKRLSHGRVIVHPKWHAAGDTSEFDQANARLVMSGKDALGLIPARAWDRLGVTSLRPLSTPFLITSDAQVKKAVTGAAVKPMLAGLSAAGVTGIGFFPEGLRHPFGVGKPLLGPADYHGGTIRTPTSATSNALITALGGTPTEAEVDQDTRGAESEYVLAPSGTRATGNVVLFPKVNVLVANSKAYSALTDDQRSTVQRAVASTQAWVNRSLSDQAAAATFCKQGGKVAEASDSDIAGLVSAARPVRRMLESDASTKRIIDALVAEIGPAKPVTIPSACATSGASASSGLAAMKGTWVVTTTAASIERAGATDAGYVNENAGTLVITFHGDGYSWTEIPQQGFSPENPTGLGDLTEQNGAVTIYWGHAAGESTTITPHRTADGRLAFTDLKDPGASSDAKALDKAQFQDAGPWTPLSKAIAGTWVTTIAAADLRDAGARNGKAAGPATLTLGGGKWMLQRPGGSSSGTYALHDQKIALKWPRGGTTTATIGSNPEGGLAFQDPTEGGSRAADDRTWDSVAFAKAWTKR